jgi:hypothetical protein
MRITQLVRRFPLNRRLFMKQVLAAHVPRAIATFSATNSGGQDGEEANRSVLVGICVCGVVDDRCLTRRVGLSTAAFCVQASLVIAEGTTTTPSGLLGELADATLAHRTRTRFEPMVMAHNLAASIELLAAGIQAIPSDQLGQSGAERSAGSLDTSFDVLRQIGQRFRRTSLRYSRDHVNRDRGSWGFPASASNAPLAALSSRCYSCIRTSLGQPCTLCVVRTFSGGSDGSGFGACL